LGESKLGVFGLAIQAWLTAVAQPVNDVAIPTLLTLNHLDVALAPTLASTPIEQVDLGALGQYLQQLGAAGLLPHSAALVRYLLEAAGLPVPDEDELAAYADPTNTDKLMTLQAKQAAAAGTAAAHPGPPPPVPHPVQAGTPVPAGSNGRARTDQAPTRRREE